MIRFIASTTMVVASAALVLPAAPLKAQDPYTVMTAIEVIGAAAGAAEKIREFFGSSDDGSERVRRDLKAIQEQNRITHVKLDQVLTILGNLKVTVREAVREELQLNSQTSLLGHIGVVYDFVDLSFGNSKERTTAAAHFREHRGPIMAIAGQLMNVDTYGYGHFDVVGQAMAAEFVISRRLREPASARVDRGRRYQDFFSKVLDPQLNGSVGAAAATARGQQQRLSAVLNIADQSIPTEAYASRKVYVGHQGWCDNPIYQDIHYKILGNRNQGYNVVETHRDNRQTKNCPHPDIHIDAGIAALAGEALADLNQAVMIPDPVDPGKSEPNARARYLNVARTVHAEAESSAAILEKAVSSAQAYLEVARKAAQGS